MLLECRHSPAAGPPDSEVALTQFLRSIRTSFCTTPVPPALSPDPAHHDLTNIEASFLTAAQKGSSGPTLARGASGDPAGLTVRARPKARPGAHAANLCDTSGALACCGGVWATLWSIGLSKTAPGSYWPGPGPDAMHEPDQGSGIKLTGLVKLGLFFAAVSAVVAAGGVDDFIQASHRNVSEGLVFAP